MNGRILQHTFSLFCQQYSPTHFPYLIILTECDTEPRNLLSPRNCVSQLNKVRKSFRRHPVLVGQRVQQYTSAYGGHHHPSRGMSLSALRRSRTGHSDEWPSMSPVPKYSYVTIVTSVVCVLIRPTRMTSVCHYILFCFCCTISDPSCSYKSIYISASVRVE